MTDLIIPRPVLNIEQSFYCFKHQLDYIFKCMHERYERAIRQVGLDKLGFGYADSEEGKEVARFIDWITCMYENIHTIEILHEKYRSVASQNYVLAPPEFMKEYSAWIRFQNENKEYNACQSIYFTKA